MSFLTRAIGTCLGSGLSPVMPGTCGSIVAALVLLPLPHAHYFWIVASLALIATLTGPPLAARFIAARGGKDPQDFVWDEAAGLWIAALRFEHPGATGILVALICFRVFDMTKPWPVRRLERLPGGHGVVYDDVAAGVLALVASLLIEQYLLS